MRRMLLGMAVLGLGLWGVGALPATAETRDESPVAVHLSKGTNDLHAVVMALKIARGLQAKGDKVVLVVDLEGVRVADARQPADLAWGHGNPIGQHYDAFVKAGGKVLVCPHCAAAVGLEARSLRAGAELAKSEEDLAAALSAARTVIDY